MPLIQTTADAIERADAMRMRMLQRSGRPARATTRRAANTRRSPRASPASSRLRFRSARTPVALAESKDEAPDRAGRRHRHLSAIACGCRSGRSSASSIMNAFANNGDFAVNAVDNLAGSGDLISIRGRATSQRPFTHRRNAQAQCRRTLPRQGTGAAAGACRYRAQADRTAERQERRNRRRSFRPSRRPSSTTSSSARSRSARNCARCGASSTPRSKRSARD